MNTNPLTVDEEYEGYQIHGIRHAEDDIIAWHYTISQAGQLIFRCIVKQENIWRDSMTSSMTVGEVGLTMVRSRITEKDFIRGFTHQEII